ncbi:MAG: hypothetical protein HY741_12805 [Chloroflexi bacterium]|nr:hypothetical protein [Chloroflexota bacterium]
MKKITLLLMALALLGLVGLAACGGREPQPSDAQVQATLQAALAATQTAQANFDNAVNAAANATAQANAAGATPQANAPTPQTIVVTATPPPGPTIIYIQTTPLPPTATPVVVTTLTEEELAALIDYAVDEAYAAALALYSATTASTQDDQVTTAESQTMTYYVQVSQQQVDEALALIEQYYAYYGDLATEALATLEAIEADLNGIEQNTDAIAQSLQEINETLAKGLELAQSTIDELEDAAQQAQTKATEVKAQAQNWYDSVKGQIETRGQNALHVKPDQIPNSAQDAAKSLLQYVETAKGLMTKGKVSMQDISKLAQQGANAKAGLERFGGANGQDLSGTIDRFTRSMARGDTPQAKKEFGGLEKNAKSFNFNGGNAGGGINPGGGGGGINPGGGGGGGKPGGGGGRP